MSNITQLKKLNQNRKTQKPHRALLGDLCVQSSLPPPGAAGGQILQGSCGPDRRSAVPAVGCAMSCRNAQSHLVYLQSLFLRTLTSSKGFLLIPVPNCADMFIGQSC